MQRAVEPAKVLGDRTRLGAIWVNGARLFAGCCASAGIVRNVLREHRVIEAYVVYFNRSRPHHGIGQNVPCGPPRRSDEPVTGKIISLPVLNGLHHEYRRGA